MRILLKLLRRSQLAPLPLFVLLLSCQRDSVVEFRRGGTTAAVIHSVESVPLTGFIHDWQPQRARLVAGSESVAVLRNARVRCLRSGEIRVEHSSRSTAVDTLIVLCRPIAGVVFLGTPPVMLRDGPRRLVFHTRDPQGNAIEELAGTVIVDDTTVVRLTGDTIFPKRVGMTWVRVDVGDCSKLLSVEVKDTVGSPLSVSPLREYDASFSLAKAEYLAVQIPKGLIGITAKSDSSDVPTNVFLGIHGANCARLSAAPNDWSCRVDSVATALLQAGDYATTGRLHIRTVGQDSFSAIRPSKRLKKNLKPESACPWILR